MTEHKVRTARKARGMSVIELSATAGVSAQTIYAIEQGRSIGSVRTMHAIAPVLGVPIAELVCFVVDQARANAEKR